MKRLSGNYLEYFLHQLIQFSPLILILWIILSVQQNTLLINPVSIALIIAPVFIIAAIGFFVLAIKISRQKLTPLYFNERDYTLRFGNESVSQNEIEQIRIIDKGTGRLILNFVEFYIIVGNRKKKVTILDQIILPIVHYYDYPRTLKLILDRIPELENKIQTYTKEN